MTITLLPALAAAFIIVLMRIGTMVMLLPGIGENTLPPRIRLSLALLLTLIYVSSPVMLVGLAVGLAISLLQALTQIQEMTIAFVPKILAIFVSLLVALPFMAEKLHDQMLRIAARIVSG
jgi:flagellar biosynthetic protein FliQ